jgi:hypothetical protein
MVSHMKSTASAILLIGLLTAASGFCDLLRLDPVENRLVPATLGTGNFSAVAVDAGTGGVIAASAGGTVYSVRDDAKTPLLPLSPILALSGCIENNKGQAFAVNPQGGIDLIGRNSAGVAHSTTLVAGNHVAVASLVKPGDKQSDYSALAARADGGIDLIGWKNGWTSANLSAEITACYIALAPLREGNGAFAVRAEGGIDKIHFDQKWIATRLLKSGNYLSICANPAPGEKTAYSSRAKGGIDFIGGSGGVWKAKSVLDDGVIYTALASAPDRPGIYAVKTMTVTRFDALPKIPEPLFGANQYGVGEPKDRAKHWPLNEDDVAYLKSLGCNSIRFPLYPSDVGLDEKQFLAVPADGSFEPAALGAPDWRSLDALMDWMILHQLTPNVCPSPELKGDWSTKTWMSLHVPENAERSVWFTKLVVDHLTEKYGDQIVYGWYESWWWNSYKHDKSTRFPAAFRKKLTEMYHGNIGDLNAAWNSSYPTFDEVEVPQILADGKQAQLSLSKSLVDPSAINSRRTFDLRKAMDLIQRDVLTELHAYIKKKAPGAKWIGGCLLNSVGALADIRNATVPSCMHSMRTAAMTGDFMSADLYSDSLEYYSHYRTLSKFAAVEDKKLFIAEVPGVKPRSFKLVADVGGPSAGAMVWVGKEDVWGLIKGDGTRRLENGKAWSELLTAYTEDKERYANYKPGSVHVYFPEETLNYSISDMNHVDALHHICDFMMPEDLELVLTDEIDKVPAIARIHVLERTLPLEAISRLEKLGDRVVSPHEYFVDENGAKHPRKISNPDFFAQLQSYPEASKLLDVFRRVEEKADNISYHSEGATVSTQSELAAANEVLPNRPHNLTNLIDGSIYDGVTFADKEQDESVVIALKAPSSVSGVFVDYFEGDGQQVPPSRVPEKTKISFSTDGKTFKQVAVLDGKGVTSRSRVRFAPVEATHVRFEFGKNTSKRGLRLVELGVVGKQS